MGKVLDMQVAEMPDPVVKWATCCDHSQQGGFLVSVNGKWLLFVPNDEGGTKCDRNGVGYCRGCKSKLSDKTPVVAWEWDSDKPLEDHFRQVQGELRGAK